MSIGTAGAPSKYDPADSLADIIENVERIEACLAGMDRQTFERGRFPAMPQRARPGDAR
jgi:hypothetical protein